MPDSRKLQPAFGGIGNKKLRPSALHHPDEKQLLQETSRVDFR